MSIRSNILAATLGLVVASGAIGGAFAQSGVSTDAAVATPPATVSATTKVTPKSAATTKKTSAITTRHRHRLAHRNLAHKKMAHRISPRPKTVAGHTSKTHLAKASSKTSVVR